MNINDLIVRKQDVAQSLANALMCLGKNDYERVRHYIEQSRRNLEDWLVQRPEKAEVGRRKDERSEVQ